eukprot:1504424-Pleurochrysis_carterae.AAC.1
MRRILRGARGLCAQWIAESVPREANGDADRLSLPPGHAARGGGGGGARGPKGARNEHPGLVLDDAAGVRAGGGGEEDRGGGVTAPRMESKRDA